MKNTTKKIIKIVMLFVLITGFLATLFSLILGIIQYGFHISKLKESLFFTLLFIWYLLEHTKVFPYSLHPTNKNKQWRFFIGIISFLCLGIMAGYLLIFSSLEPQDAIPHRINHILNPINYVLIIVLCLLMIVRLFIYFPIKKRSDSPSAPK